MSNGPTRLLALLALWAAAAPLAAQQRPNVLLLYADDMGYGDLGAQNPGSRIPTPNLDRLAREGLRCTDAHSSSGICSPSRYALLTGRYHWRRLHGIVGVFGEPVLEPERLTLPELLRAQGYRTACIGKWHLGWDWGGLLRAGAEPRPGSGYAAADFDWSRPIPGGPLAHGFDHYFGDDVPNFPPYTWIEDERVLRAPSVPLAVAPRPAEGSPECRPGPMAEGWRLDAVLPELTARAVAWIGRQAGREQPFFLYVPFTSPHAPIVPAEAFQGRSEAGPYGDFVAQTDDAVGRILAALEEHGLAGDTLVVFTSDNGPEHYAYERTRRFGHWSAGPLRGLKRDVWEGGHRVPFLVRWPGVVEPGRVSDALVGQVDLMATLAAVVGAALPDDAAEDSVDQLPLLRGESEGVRRELVHNTRANGYALRRGRWLLLDTPTGTITRVPEWFASERGYGEDPHPGALYDLAEDLGQRRNRYADQPELVAELRARLARIREQGHSAPRLEGDGSR